MHEKNIDLLRKEADRLLKQQINLLLKVKDAPHVLSKSKATGDQTLDLDSVPKRIAMLEDQVSKLGSLNLVMAVVGTMKAGKSTTINAIVGAEVLPNRNRPMTALPTLIRHTPNVRQPRLTFRNPEPINRLIEILRTAASRPDFSNVSEDADMRQLLIDIRHAKPYSANYEGSDSIFDFLKGLNDLVRLSTALGEVFPFDDYSRIEAVPLIEVEFTHLRELEGVQGSLSLLDTPGPNEAGQDRLRVMLNEQLRKADAVLAVLDYTQLKSDADDEVRNQLKGIVKVTEGRLSILVNKFDQRDRNGDNEEQTRKYVAIQLMDRAVSVDRIYPVSSKLGYLASRARSELALHGRLPNPTSNPWVEDFGEEAIGRRWHSQVADPGTVNEAADELWKDSHFSEPLSQVIGEAYSKAALLAVDSAAAKMVHLAEDLKNFLGTKRQALKKSSEEIRRQVDALKKDIDEVSNGEKAAAKDVTCALSNVSTGIRRSSESAQKESLKILEKYFKEGKSIEAQQAEKDPKSREKKVGGVDAASLFSMILEGFRSRDDGKDFDPKSMVIKMDSLGEAEKFVKKIVKSIEVALQTSEIELRDGIKSQLQEFRNQFAQHVATAEELVKRLRGRMADFDLTIRMPDVRAASFELSLSDVLDNAIAQKSESRTSSRRQSGLWGTACGWFKTEDWGLGDV